MTGAFAVFAQVAGAVLLVVGMWFVAPVAGVLSAGVLLLLAGTLAERSTAPDPLPPDWVPPSAALIPPQGS